MTACNIRARIERIEPEHSKPEGAVARALRRLYQSTTTYVYQYLPDDPMNQVIEEATRLGPEVAAKILRRHVREG